MLWLADEQGWAYDAIVQNVSAQLPGYEHVVFYMMAEHPTKEWIIFGELLDMADIVVSMHLMYQKQLIADGQAGNIALMLTGPRLFE